MAPEEKGPLTRIQGFRVRRDQFYAIFLNDIPKVKAESANLRPKQGRIDNLHMFLLHMLL